MIKSRKNLIIVGLIMLIATIGISYAFFYYNKLGTKNQKLIAGQIYLKLNDDADSISLSPIFPQTVEKARERTDNVLSFSISGVNTTENKDLYYEIKLNEALDIVGKTRFNPGDLRFDLTEIVDGTRTLVVDNLSYSDFEDRRIWVNTVDHDTTTEINIQYELRMWLSDSVLISDTRPNPDYTTEQYMNSYANVKIAVYGDFVEKSVPYNYMVSSFPTAITDNKANISEVRFMNITSEELSELNVETIDLTYNNQGNVSGWFVENENDSTKSILYIGSEGTIFLTTGNSLFSSWTNLKTVDFANVNTSRVTNMSFMFYNCTNLTSLDISNFDVSNVNNTSYMFDSCKNLISLNMGNWNVSNVTNMANMFCWCSNLTNLDVVNWDVSNVTNMRYMFCQCNVLADIDVSNWNVSNVTDMSYMFDSCNALTTLNVSKWDVSSVTDMANMFKYCNNLVSLDLSKWDVGSVTNMSYMFCQCNNLTTLNISNWDVSNVINMSYMFDACNKVTSFDVGNWNVGNVTDMTNMFIWCSSLTNLDVSKWNVSNVTSMKYMFCQCNALTSLDVSNWNVGKVTDMSYIFDNCNALAILDVSNWNVSNVTNMNSMFKACKSLTSLDLSGWDVSKVTDMTYTFDSCVILTTIYANTNWQTIATNLSSSSYMFTGCYQLVGAVSFDGSNTNDITYANPDTGYFTSKTV